MFEIGWTEMLVIAVVMIVVVGPKDLPGMLRSFGRTSAKLRSMAGDFQKQFNEALKEAELEDVKKSVDALRSLNPTAEIKKQLNPFEKAAADVRAGLHAAMKPSKAAEPPNAATHAAEPLKTAATALPGVAEPAALPGAPAFTPVPTPASPAEVTAKPSAEKIASPANGAAPTAVAAQKPKRAARPRAAKKPAEIAP